jgi:restriction system protein
MTVPTYNHFIEPLLRYLAAHADGATIADVYEALAGEMKLTPEDRAELLPSGTQAVFKNRIGWAHDRLKRSGSLGQPAPWGSGS